MDLTIKLDPEKIHNALDPVYPGLADNFLETVSKYKSAETASFKYLVEAQGVVNVQELFKEVYGEAPEKLPDRLEKQLDCFYAYYMDTVVNINNGLAEFNEKFKRQKFSNQEAKKYIDMLVKDMDGFIETYSII